MSTDTVAPPPGLSVEEITKTLAPRSGLRTTGEAVARSIATVTAECRAVDETLEAVGGALGGLGSGSGSDQGMDWGGFGMVGLPIVAAMKTVRTVANRYVEQQTGMRLTAWTELVTRSSEQFDDYLGQLDRAAAVVAASGVRRDAPGDPAPDVAVLDALDDLRRSTTGWKLILTRVVQLGKVVDAVLRATEGPLGDPGTDAPSEPTAGGFASFQRKLKDVQSRTVDRTGDLREWIVRPLLDVRDRIHRLPQDVARLTADVELLEVLLDLETSGLRVAAGEAPPAAARVAVARTAVLAWLPELARDHALAEVDRSAYRTRLERLDAAHATGAVTEHAWERLREEYRAALDESRLTLETLDALVSTWRDHGPSLLATCEQWVAEEVALLDARRIAEQTEPAGDRPALLRREGRRIEEARALLSSLLDGS